MLIDQFSGVSMSDLLSEVGANLPLCDEKMTARVELTLGKK